MEITTIDLLRKVHRSTPPDKPRAGLNDRERELVLGCFTDPTYHDTRDRAFVAVAMATGLRFEEILELPLSSFDRLHGELVIRGKGNRVRTARLSPRALKYVRAYLKDRPASDSDRLWLTEYGQPLTYQGGYSIIKRIRRKSGVDRIHWHLFRHGFAQHALVAGAHQGLVQEMLGHASPAMTRKYLGYVKQREAARQMPQFSPI
jgi:site-specific recombinase XerD